MDQITIDGLEENRFRASIEGMLRLGDVDGAAQRLRALLAPYARDGGVLPARFMTVKPGELWLAGWDQLGERLRRYDRPNNRISALSVAMTEPNGAEAPPAHSGERAPSLETSYFSDDAFPFSEAGRDDLLDGYSHYGCEWQGDSEQTDTALSLKGADDLYGAVAQLEARLLASAEPDAEEIRAGTLGACYLGVLLHQTVRENIRSSGLPRALCVMAGSNGVYPFFDAPVISTEEYAEQGGTTAVAQAADEPEARAQSANAGNTYNSLLSVQSRKGKKQPVMLLDAAESEAAAREHEAIAAQHMAGAGTAPRRSTVVNFEPYAAEPELAADPDTSSVEDLTEEAWPVEIETTPFLEHAEALPPLSSPEPALRDEVPATFAPPSPEPVETAFDVIEPAEEIAHEHMSGDLPPVAAPTPIKMPQAIAQPRVEAPLRLDEADWIKALARHEEPPPLLRSAPPADTGLGHRGHRLRARMVAPPTRDHTSGSRIMAFLRSIGLFKRR